MKYKSHGANQEPVGEPHPSLVPDADADVVCPKGGVMVILSSLKALT